MNPALTTLRRLAAMLEAAKPRPYGFPVIFDIPTEAGTYIIRGPARERPDIWAWGHEDDERHGSARTLYDALDEVMGDIDWNTCQQCRRTHDVEGNGKFCAACLADMGEAQADAEADAADNRLATIREAGL